MNAFNGFGLSNLSLLSNAKSRSISPENFTGAKGQGGMATEGTGKECARDLGQGWKVSPSVIVKAQTNFTLGEIEGPGVIQHIWMTCFPSHWRSLVLRIYWDDEEQASVETPIGDFSAMVGAAFQCQFSPHRS